MSNFSNEFGTTNETAKKENLNTHNHIDYGGDDAEHSLRPSKKLTPNQRKMKAIIYTGD